MTKYVYNIVSGSAPGSHTNQLTTAFTILFVTIITTLFKRFTLWRAQRGDASVATLEQYQASVSLPSTLKIAISLNAFTLRSLGLIFIWCFYYLGSQASSREFTLKASKPYAHFPVWVPDFFNASRPYRSGVPVDDIAKINLRFIKDLGLQQKTWPAYSSSYDLYGRPFVPILEYSGEMDKDGWWKLAWDGSGEVTYAGWEGLSQNTNLNQGAGFLVGKYETNMSYFRLHCDPIGWSTSLSLNISTTQSLLLTPVDDGLSGSSTDSSYPRRFQLLSKSPGGVSFTTCNVSMVSLEMRVECKSGNCAAIKFRPVLNYSTVPSSKNSRSHNATLELAESSHSSYSTPFNDITLFTSFLQNLALATGLPPDNSTSSPLEIMWRSNLQGMTENQTPIQSQSLVNLYAATNPLSVDSDPDAASREYLTSWLTSWLTGAINTYYALYLNQATADFDPTSISGDNQVLKDALTESGNWTVSQMHGAEYLPAYRISVPWIVVDFISCMILVKAAIISALLRRQTLAPDIFGYVSSITRENPHIPESENGSTLSGLERARMMKKVKIRIADVSQGEEIGRIGVAVVQGAQTGHAPIQKDKHYF